MTKRGEETKTNKFEPRMKKYYGCSEIGVYMHISCNKLGNNFLYVIIITR